MRISEYLVKAGVPPKYRNCKLSDIQLLEEFQMQQMDLAAYQKLYDKCEPLCDDFKFGAYIYGCGGNGKTWLAVAMLARYLKAGRRVAMTTPYEIRDYYFDGFQGIRQRYLDADVLLIDALDKKLEVNNDFNLQIIEAIIRQRDERGAITLYTATDEAAELRFSGDTIGIKSIILGTTIRVPLPNVDLRKLAVSIYANELKGKQ